MYVTQHPKPDVDGLYLQRCEVRKGLIVLENCAQAKVYGLEKYPRTSKEKILKQEPFHGQLRKATEEVRGKRSWDWFKNVYLKKGTESTIVVAQDLALCTRNIRNVV